MQTFDEIVNARAAIMDFHADHFAEIDERFRDRFKTLAASAIPPQQIVGLGEFIYANRGDMPNSAKALAAGLIAFATTNAWHQLLDDNRGNSIVANLRKDIGEIKTAPAAPDPLPDAVIAKPSTKDGSPAPSVVGA